MQVSAPSLGLVLRIVQGAPEAYCFDGVAAAGTRADCKGGIEACAAGGSVANQGSKEMIMARGAVGGHQR